jgi:hypothetical protein
MFLDKPEDIAYFNRVMRDSPHLEHYFAELAVWAWIYKKDEYLEIVKTYQEGELAVPPLTPMLNVEEGVTGGTLSSPEKMEIEENN